MHAPLCPCVLHHHSRLQSVCQQRIFLLHLMLIRVSLPQEILHVMAPHYSHMFEGVFSRPRPWLFGHLYLPGGSKNLGAPSYELSSGSGAPLVGTLAQVTRAVRLRDGKFLILATAVTRFKASTLLASSWYFACFFVMWPCFMLLHLAVAMAPSRVHVGLPAMLSCLFLIQLSNNLATNKIQCITCS